MTRFATLLAGVALLLAAPSALAATPGALSELPGPGGCVLNVDENSTAGTCNPGNALSDGAGIALAPDGRNVYVTSGDDNAVAVLARDPATGNIRQLDGEAGCVATPGTVRTGRPCALGRHLGGAGGLVVSPDGRFVYVASAFANALTAFSRDPATGVLTQLDGLAGCVARAEADCTGDPRMGQMFGIAISADGSFVYTAGSDRLLAFSRDAATGALAPVASGGCVANRARPGCTTGHGLRSAIGLGLSRDGHSLYVASFSSRSVALLNVSGGALSQPSGRRGCWSSARKSDGCAAARGLPDAQRVTVSRDGRNVYVLSRDPASVAIFKRKAGGTLSQLAGPRGCIGPKGCRKAVGLVGGSGLAVAPNGRNVYVTTDYSDALLSFSRGSGGALTQLPGRAGCIIDAKDKLKGCTPAARALIDNPEAVVLTPDGRYLYVAAGGVDAFRRS